MFQKAGLRSRFYTQVLFALLVLSFQFQGLASAGETRVALVFDVGGKDDQSFNSAALQGATKAKNELKTQLKYVEPTDHNSFETLLRSFAEKKYDLIISVGVAQSEAVAKVSKRYPNQKFAIIDAEVKAPNVTSFLFQENEGSYLVGAIAAMVSKTGTVGFVGGIDIPLVRRFAAGYKAGVRSIKPKGNVIINFVGNTGESWNNPTKAKELALSQYGSGADVIFGVAGASGSGIFDAAEERNKLAIGVDSNQNWIKPGFVLTSMVKRVDQAVFHLCENIAKGQFTPGTVLYDLANQGIDYSVDRFNEKVLPAAVRKKADEIKAGIIAGKIQVPDYYKDGKLM